MRDIHLRIGNPLSLVLAADARLTTTKYHNDQIWELTLQGGDPPALAISTTYGLRALSMRMFPRFIEAGVSIMDPIAFAGTPSIRKIYPNALEVHYAPFPGLLVVGEYWVPGSDIIAGRIRMTNSSPRSRRINFEWVALLYSSDNMQTIIPDTIANVAVLSGSTDGLKPLIFMSGGAFSHTSPYPALSITADLSPGKSSQYIWCQVARIDPGESFKCAQTIAGGQWDAEITRISHRNSNHIEIITGDMDWDAAFGIAQKSAVNFLHSPTEHLPNTSSVSTRRPDQGYSLRGDGSDYDHLWSGQTPLEAYYLGDYFLPGEPSLVEGFLLNFLFTQNESGELEWKPGLGGQRNKHLATPILATLALHTYQFTSNQDFLEQVYSPFKRFFLSWFSPIHDRDQDGIPEWDHPMQFGIADHPLFARWHTWSQGVDITTAESPALCAFLYRECDSLIKMAEVLGKQSEIPFLEGFHERLRTEIESFWDAENSTFHYRDRDLHSSPSPSLISDCLGSGTLELNLSFSGPVRLAFSIEAEDETTRRPQISIHGSSPSGSHRVENISTDKILWFPGWGTATTEKAYIHVEYVDIRGLNEKDRLLIRVVGYSTPDLTNLLPLWAGMLSKEKAQALIKNVITDSNCFWKPFGLPYCPGAPGDPEAEICQAINLPLGSMIAEGMLQYGYRQEAADLMIREMHAIIMALKKESAFREFYHAETGAGMGERHALSGLPPIGLFFKALGVQIFSGDKVLLEGFNPFPWSITLKYRGLTILRARERTQVIFRNGQTFSTDDQRPQMIAL